jgi:hypothetical protein
LRQPLYGLVAERREERYLRKKLAGAQSESGLIARGSVTIVTHVLLTSDNVSA